MIFYLKSNIWADGSLEVCVKVNTPQIKQVKEEEYLR